MPITDLEPRHLWQQFDRIRQIPRPSKHEGRIREYVLDWAKAGQHETVSDAVGNVIVRVRATPGHEKAPCVVVQSHMDMVCEKNRDVTFDFMNDPIQLERRGDWLYAKGTTLGSDNGIGMAAAMALADDPEVVHGPLELLITVDEETGLTGAKGLDGKLIKGRRLLNLDTEALGAIYIGCAGGGDSTITLPVVHDKLSTDPSVRHIKVSGLRGGHSGMDIVEQRGNAIKSLARIISRVQQEHSVRLARIEGGGVHNAIPREASADLVCAAKSVDAVDELIGIEAASIRDELGETEPGFKVSIESGVPSTVWDADTTRRIVGFLQALPHGVDRMSRDVPGLVETSNNVASVWTRDAGVVVGTSSRSSINSAMQAMRDRIRATAEMVGADVEENDAYPGWKPDLTSEVMAITRDVHREVFGKVPEIKAVHAGLECGVIGERCPGMDMVSFGPTIEAPHSPDERVNIPSVSVFWDVLTRVVAKLAAG